MTKQHFIALADAIKAHGDLFGAEHIHVLAQFCQEQNINFNGDRWIDYIAGKCGKSGGKVKQAA